MADQLCADLLQVVFDFVGFSALQVRLVCSKWCILWDSLELEPPNHISTRVRQALVNELRRNGFFDRRADWHYLPDAFIPLLPQALLRVCSQHVKQNHESEFGMMVASFFGSLNHAGFYCNSKFMLNSFYPDSDKAWRCRYQMKNKRKRNSYDKAYTLQLDLVNFVFEAVFGEDRADEILPTVKCSVFRSLMERLVVPRCSVCCASEQPNYHWPVYPVVRCCKGGTEFIDFPLMTCNECTSELCFLQAGVSSASNVISTHKFSTLK